MTSTPFRDTAKKISASMDYVNMQVLSEGARSHGWWRNLVEQGAWGGAQGRVGPPTPEAIPGIAKLFGTTREQVSVMIAADWYDVQPGSVTSARTMRIAPLLDTLDERSAEAIEFLVSRLAQGAPDPKTNGSRAPHRIVRRPR